MTSCLRRARCAQTVELLNSIPTVHGHVRHAAARRVKKWNRRVYYTLKYSLTLVVLGLIVASALP